VKVTSSSSSGVSKPVISKEVRDRYEEDEVSMQQALSMLKRDIEGQIKERA
jgi:hypothetical protein